MHSSVDQHLCHFYFWTIGNICTQTQEVMYYDSIYMKLPKQVKPIETYTTN